MLKMEWTVVEAGGVVENGDSGEGVVGRWLCAEGGSGRRNLLVEGVTGRGEGRSGVQPGGRAGGLDMIGVLLGEGVGGGVGGGEVGVGGSRWCWEAVSSETANWRENGGLGGGGGIRVGDGVGGMQ